jgi:hypothetical protein
VDNLPPVFSLSSYDGALAQLEKISNEGTDKRAEDLFVLTGKCRKKGAVAFKHIFESRRVDEAELSIAFLTPFPCVLSTPCRMTLLSEA